MVGGPIRRREGGKLRSRSYGVDAVAVGEKGEVFALGSCKWPGGDGDGHEHGAEELAKLELVRDELTLPRPASAASTGSASPRD
jgi:hypothetical protein